MMRQPENHDWRKLAQPAHAQEGLCGACASAPVRQSPLGDGGTLAQQSALFADDGRRTKSRTLNWRTTGATGCRLISTDKWVFPR
jgi:hypothetical protein